MYILNTKLIHKTRLLKRAVLTEMHYLSLRCLELEVNAPLCVWCRMPFNTWRSV